MNNFFLFTVFLLLSSTIIHGQSDKLYLPLKIQNAYQSGTRSQTGAPGDNYWQNFASYSIDAEFDTKTRKLSGHETITYHNNSPDTLRHIVIKLLQNIHQKGAAKDFQINPESLHDGMVVERIIMDLDTMDLNNKSQVFFYGTNLYLILKEHSVVLPGNKSTIQIHWSYDVVDVTIRTGAYNDSAFFIGYWFPQIAVYDDIVGWDQQQYTGVEETYNDMADFDVKITTDESFIVWATGDLINKEDIFSRDILKRIDESMESDKIVAIVQESDYDQNRVFTKKASQTWHYVVKNVPDFAFALSNHYCWDATSTIVDHETGRRTWVNTVFPPSAKGFKKSIYWAAKSISYFSDTFPGIPFPYNKHISFNGHNHTAMEFPMMANDCDSDKDEYLTEIVAHEIAHTYFPFTVLSNERTNAWIDEGLVKLFGERFTETYGNNRVDFKALNTTRYYDKYAGSISDLPLITPTTSLSPNQNFSHSYAKATTANVYLFEYLGNKGYDDPIKEFIHRWEGKHPTPWDYFNTVNAVTGEDLTWFWKPWYFEFGYPDLSIELVEEGSNPKISVKNNGGLPVPLILEITYQDGTTENIRKEMDTWIDRDLIEISVNTLGRQIQSIKLGDNYIIDAFPDDNYWQNSALNNESAKLSY